MVVAHRRVAVEADKGSIVPEAATNIGLGNAMAGVGMRVVRWERAPVSIGKKILESVRSELRGADATETTKKQVQELGQRIVEQELAAARDLPQIENLRR